ncbi:hypothetical protein DEO72_LG5g2642 [Vigna unguiculata]|uniref:Uncharacterized protein n=1 Tax=Vigna unguiculata TaxID=3917 RepID=A0A4D6M1S6_VIGUN|nr:hypothetical protein DEO72_LG5g2642 [Vigna unguiculata]
MAPGDRGVQPGGMCRHRLAVLRLRQAMKLLSRACLCDVSKPKKNKAYAFPSYPLSAAKLYQNHLHQHHLLPCTVYTIITNHKQIGSKIAWRGTHAARHCQLQDRLAVDAYRQALNASKLNYASGPAWRVYSHRQAQVFQSPLSCQFSPGEPLLAARRPALQMSLFLSLLPGGLDSAARHYTRIPYPGMCRQAVPSPGTPKLAKIDVSPDSDSSPAKRFLENFQKRRIS